MNRAALPNPNGIPSPSPGLASRAYPGSVAGNLPNPNGVVARDRCQGAATPSGLREIRGTAPKVARASQPWAVGRNPVGILPHAPEHRLGLTGGVADADE